MAKIIFDSKNVKPARTFAFGLDASDWDRAAEDAMYLDAVCDGAVISTGPIPAPAVEPEPTDAGAYVAPPAAARTWWTALTLGMATDGYMVEGESVRAARPAPAPKPRTRPTAGDELALPSNVKRVAIVSGKRRGEPLRKMGRLWVGIESGELVAGETVLRAYRNGRLAILPDVAAEVDEDAMMHAYCQAEHERMEWARMEAAGAR